ncbi:serine/threonine-protein phosphatase 7 long form homolog [Lathyrus oleraceus]|uniref:serine/threonine-protein phosphatase 7 long form homolog n=1 Tax=Pisum sativum TaxID=3888 RepID=UPI0021D1FBCE|nr:serine/threonine-protein phosphatase 7 long form homolog [Pisum sativum]
MSLLTMGDEHRGTIENISTFDPKRFRCRVHEYVPHDPLIEPYIRGCGFGNLLNIVSYSVDYKFILALLERWRPETHTFHLPIGECTVTLEDVYMLLGLRIDGKAVNGKVNHVNDICNELLGAPLLDDEPEGDTSSQARGQGINLKYLRQYYNSIVLSEDSTELHKAFNGEQEFDIAPKPLNGKEVYRKQQHIKVTFEKKQKKFMEKNIWKKRSVFFDLSYWSSLDTLS